jgi:hypothetical protein
MMKSAVLSLLLASASAFAPASQVSFMNMMLSVEASQ